MNCTVESSFTDNCKIIFEHSLAIGGYTYLVIFGSHVNGGFICVPNWKWGCEASNLTGSIGYNQEKLIEVGCPENVAKEIAKHIETVLQNA